MDTRNKFLQLTGTGYPIVQAPMLGVSTPEMAAAASNAGALGSLPLGGLSANNARTLIQKVKTLTHQPFAVNLFVYDYPTVVDSKDFDAMQHFLQDFCTQNHIPYKQQSLDSLPFFSYKELIPVILEEKVRIVSFTFGIPTDDEIKLMHDHGILLQGTATSVEEVLLLDSKDIDIITVQGIEAGGHRGSFMEGEELPEVSLSELLQQAITNTNKPIVAAGGIYDGSTLQNAIGAGASAVQMGTVFIASNESAAAPSYKNALFENGVTTKLTRTYSGRWARSIPNQLMDAIQDSGLTILPYPVQHLLTTPIRNWAKENDRKQYIFLLAGESAAKSQPKPVAAIIEEIVTQAELGK